MLPPLYLFIFFHIYFESFFASSLSSFTTLQELSHQFFEEESFSSLLSGTDPESLMSFEEAYQPSPNSVLEPFYNKEISSISECFKSVNASLHG